MVVNYFVNLDFQMLQMICHLLCDKMMSVLVACLVISYCLSEQTLSGIQGLLDLPTVNQVLIILRSCRQIIDGLCVWDIISLYEHRLNGQK